MPLNPPCLLDLQGTVDDPAPNTDNLVPAADDPARVTDNLVPVEDGRTRRQRPFYKPETGSQVGSLTFGDVCRGGEGACMPRG